MNTTIPKIIAFGLALTTLIILTGHYPTNAWALLAVALIVNIISAPVGFYIIEVLANIKRLPTLFITKIILRNQYVRLSFSYLIRIKVKGRYLLVKNRKGNYFQL